MRVCQKKVRTFSVLSPLLLVSQTPMPRVSPKAPRKAPLVQRGDQPPLPPGDADDSSSWSTSDSEDGQFGPISQTIPNQHEQTPNAAHQHWPVIFINPHTFMISDVKGRHLGPRTKDSRVDLVWTGMEGKKDILATTSEGKVKEFNRYGCLF